jgi:beta-galactosidase
MPSRRSTKLRLYVDNPSLFTVHPLQGAGGLSLASPLIADGSDFVVVVCEVTDDNGNVRRLAKENIVFTVEGEGEIIGDVSINANPRAVEWGSAPILIRSTRKAGKIKIHAEVQFPGTHAPTPADIEIESIPYPGLFCDGIMKTPSPAFPNEVGKTATTADGKGSMILSPEEKARLLKEVQEQQADFGIGQ